MTHKKPGPLESPRFKMSYMQVLHGPPHLQKTELLQPVWLGLVWVPLHCPQQEGGGVGFGGDTRRRNEKTYLEAVACPWECQKLGQECCSPPQYYRNDEVPRARVLRPFYGVYRERPRTALGQNLR